MQDINKLWRWSGVAGVIVLWAAIGLAMQRAGLSLVDVRPISYLGVLPDTAWLFSGGLLVSAGLFIAFAYYVRRHFRVYNRFLTYFLIGMTGQIVAAIIPYGEQSDLRLVHTVAAYFLAFSLPLLIQQFKQSQLRSPKLPIYQWLLYLEGVAFVVGLGLFIFTKGIAPLGEALPAMGFHLWIITVSILE